MYHLFDDFIRGICCEKARLNASLVLCSTNVCLYVHTADRST